MSRLNKSLFGLVAISASTVNSSSSLLLPGISVAMPPQIQSIIRNGSSLANGIKTADPTKRVSEAKDIVQSADIVCFDVDSTVIVEEGIDELAEYCGKGQEVAALTREAMGGSMTFQEALRRRLDIIKPSQRQIRDFLRLRPSTLSPGIKEFIDHLRAQDKKIYLISGGFHSLIDPVAQELSVPIQNLFANKLLFDFKGNYGGFDTNQPTSRSGGKGEAINQIRKYNSSQLQADERMTILMIGDGATDLESSPPADYFIGYGGNIVRESVMEKSHYFVTDFRQLMK